MKIYLNLMIFSGLVCGFLFPQIGKAAGMIPWIILAILFFSFLEMPLVFHRLLRKEFLITGLLSAIVMPAFAHMVLSRGLDPAYHIGLILIACAPAGLMTIVLTQYIPNGDNQLAFGNFIFTQFSAIIFIPLVLKLSIGRQVAIDPLPILVQICVLLAGPFLCSRVTRMMLPRQSRLKLKKYTEILMPILLALVIAISIGNAAYEVDWTPALLKLTFSVFVIFMLQGVIGLATGAWIGGRRIANTMAFICSSRNGQLILAIAVLNFPPLTSIPIIVAVIAHHVTNAFWLWALQAKKRQGDGPSPTV